MIDSKRVLERENYTEDSLGISREAVVRSIRSELAPDEEERVIDRYLQGTTTELRQSLQTVRGLPVSGDLRLPAVYLALQIIQGTPNAARVGFPIIRQRLLQDRGFAAAQEALDRARQ